MFRLLFALLLIPFFGQVAAAQGQPCFKALINGREVTEICVNTDVQFIDQSGTTGGTEFYDTDNANGQFDNGQQNSLSKRFKFSTPGTYVVTQLLTVPGSPSSTCNRTFIVRATPPPQFTALACGPNQ